MDIIGMLGACLSYTVYHDYLLQSGHKTDWNRLTLEGVGPCLFIISHKNFKKIGAHKIHTLSLILSSI